jgi:hypothetical protein
MRVLIGGTQTEDLMTEAGKALKAEPRKADSL